MNAGNASRRLVLITGSMLFFGQEFLPKHMFGIALLMSGVFAYTYVSKSQAAVDSTNKTAVPVGLMSQTQSNEWIKLNQLGIKNEGYGRLADGCMRARCLALRGGFVSCA
eukprot:TRINITY_DN10190_c0_g3_i1.p1 TRINITY_DN10190_c0_g3~~TRINITY_DN10190_c0_g3_i1.p1  ORF type:complete len:110 (+),score=11.99 TRINITY_DN10190_c0_g3_i1:81-410(+)